MIVSMVMTGVMYDLADDSEDPDGKYETHGRWEYED